MNYRLNNDFETLKGQNRCLDNLNQTNAVKYIVNFNFVLNITIYTKIFHAESRGVA